MTMMTQETMATIKPTTDAMAIAMALVVAMDMAR